MKIKSLINCWTPSPERKWIKGEVVDVSDEIGKKLLLNKNFVKVSASKTETENEEKENVKYRKKRGIGDRD